MMMLLNDGMTFKKLNKYLSSQVLGDQSAVSQSGYHRHRHGVSSQFDLDLDPLHFDIGSPPFRYRCPPVRRTIYLGNMYF